MAMVFVVVDPTLRVLFVQYEKPTTGNTVVVVEQADAPVIPPLGITFVSQEWLDAQMTLAEWDAEQAKIEQARQDMMGLPNWATWTGQEAAEALRVGILAGMTKEQARAAIDAQFAGVNSLATLGAATVAILKQLSDAIIDGRDLGHQNEARAIMYLRDMNAG